MYSGTLRVASGGTRLGLALGRIGRTRGGGAAAPVGVARGRSVTAMSASNAPVSGDQGFAMEKPPQQQQQQQQPQVAPQDAGAMNKRDEVHKNIGCLMRHSFGEEYATRCEEEGFGGVYGRYDSWELLGTEIHPSHPDYDALQGSEVKEKEKARHLDEKNAT